MIKFLKRNIYTILILIGIILLYFVLRLPNLTYQPIFADEAIYIRWAQVMRAEPTLRFLPLSDGKTPLFMWILMPVFKIFKDPLFAGRFLSTASGFLTLLGVLFLGWRFFNKKVGLWSALLIAITPYIFFFDRMALVDSMLSAFSIWSLNLILLLIAYQRIDLAMFLGYALGGALLTKTTGLFNILSLPAALVCFDWGRKNRQNRLVKTFGLVIFSIIIAFLIYNLLRLGPGFDNLSRRNQDYIFSPLDLIGRPFDPFIPHLTDLIDWLPELLTLPILLSVAGGVVLAIIKKNQTSLTILLWALFPIIVQMFLLRTFTARYLLFSIPPMLCLAGWTFYTISRRVKLKYFSALLLISVFPLALNFNYLLMNDLGSVPLPKEERNGYLENWTAGYGFPEIARFLMTQAQKGTIAVGTEGTFGTLPDGLLIYLDDYMHKAPDNQRILIVGGKAFVSAQLRDLARRMPTYFIANKSRYPSPELNVVLIKNFPKIKGVKAPQDEILFYQVFPLP